MSTNRERVKHCQAIIQEAQVKFVDAVETAKGIRYEEQKVAKAELAILKHKYEQKMYDRAKEIGYVPVSRWGVHQPHNDCVVNSLGIILCWDNDDGPDDHFEMTWEEIEKAFGA